MANLAKATQENNFTVSVKWHNALSERPPKSGLYIYWMGHNHLSCANYSKLNDEFNSYDSIEPDPNSDFNLGVRFWARIPPKGAMVSANIPPVNSHRHEYYFVQQDENSTWRDFLWYNEEFNLFNSLNGDTWGEALKYAIEVDRWCRIAPPEGYSTHDD